MLNFKKALCETLSPPSHPYLLSSSTLPHVTYSLSPSSSSGDGYHHVLYRRFSGEEERIAGVFPCYLQVSVCMGVLTSRLHLHRRSVGAVLGRSYVTADIKGQRSAHRYSYQPQGMWLNQHCVCVYVWLWVSEYINVSSVSSLCLHNSWCVHACICMKKVATKRHGHTVCGIIHHEQCGTWCQLWIVLSFKNKCRETM